MHISIIRFFFLTFLLQVLTTGCSHKGAEEFEVFIPYVEERTFPGHGFSRDYRVTILDGRGRVAFKFPNDKKKSTTRYKNSWGEWEFKPRYYEPSVHPFENRMVCVKRTEKSCSLVDVIFGREESEKNIYDAKWFPASPVWSPDGKYIAFIEKVSKKTQKDKKVSFEDITVLRILEPSSQKIEHEHEIPIDHYFIDPLERYGIPKSYIRWSRDGKLIYYLNNKDIISHYIGEIDINSGEIHPILNTNFNFMYNKSRKSSKTMSHPSVFELLGSPENPRLNPIWSRNQKYYFYYTYDEGFLANGWISKYSPSTSEEVRVKTLWWNLYQK